MIRHQQIWLPDGETHMVDWMTRNGELVDDRGTYQIKKLRAALEHCRDFRMAVDIGAHVGLWTMQLAKRFENVTSFEPITEHRDCFLKNVTQDNVHLIGCALGEKEDIVAMGTVKSSSGSTMVVSVNGNGHAYRLEMQDGVHTNVPLKTLDSFDLEDVDFIKLDCEGFEYYALKGGERTIHDCRPTIIVEQKPGRGQRFGLTEQAGVDYLREHHGYRLAEALAGDFIMVPG